MAGDDEDNGGTPSIPIPPSFSLSDSLRLIRKYNGRTNVDEWIKKFEHDLTVFGISYRYAVVSLDRFVVEDALAWWSSVSHLHEVEGEDETEFENAWGNIKAQMKEFFDHSVLQAMNRKKNKELRFRVGDDPQSYVTKKLALFKEIDSSMSETKKVQNLIRGLPSDLQLQFASQNIADSSSFMKRLRVYCDILADNKPTTSNTPKTEPKQNAASFFFTPPPSNYTMRALNPSSSSRPMQTNGNRSCFNCGEVGHFVKQCPKPRIQHANVVNNVRQQPSSYAQNPYMRPQQQNPFFAYNRGMFPPMNAYMQQAPYFHPYMNNMNSPFFRPPRQNFNNPNWQNRAHQFQLQAAPPQNNVPPMNALPPPPQQNMLQISEVTDPNAYVSGANTGEQPEN